MQIQRTPHGFDWKAATTLRPAPLAEGPRAWLRPWSCAKIECLASDEKKGWIYLGVTIPRDSIEIYITKSGKMRVYNAKDSTNKKEML